MSSILFRSVHSTLSQLILTQALITNDVDNRLCMDAIYTDLSKAFDSLSHTKLLHKLKAYGLDFCTFNWIRSFLLGRSQRVVINSAYSSWLNCISGIPQGSVFGPLLFLISINDLPDVVTHSNILLYADDAKVLKTIVSRLDCIHLQANLDAISLWCTSWQLHLNISKCFTVRFGLVDKPSFSYSFNGTVVAAVENVTDLGVTINKQMSFTNNCHLIV